jgi:plastocyanin
MTGKRTRGLVGLGMIITVALAADLQAQPLTYRSPNVTGTWITSPWNLYFGLNHRFRILGDENIADIFDDALLKNSPTLTLDLGLWAPFMIGVQYASDPAIRNGRRNNEWFPYLKAAPWRDERWSMSVLGGYNSQAESVDGVFSAQASIGAFELLGAVRAFSDALHVGEAGLVLAGGLGIHVTDYILLAADLGGFVAGPDTAAAWSAGINFAIPFTPHTVSLQVTNSSATTPQEASFAGIDARGGGVAWGFEFTVPFSGFARWGRIFDRGQDDKSRAEGQQVEPPRVTEIDIREMRFKADTIRAPVGSAVRWVNRDPVAHTIAADEGEWQSPLVGPGETYTTRLEHEGTFPYYCTLHPFMKAVIIVESRS